MASLTLSDGGVIFTTIAALAGIGFTVYKLRHTRRRTSQVDLKKHAKEVLDFLQDQEMAKLRKSLFCD